MRVLKRQVAESLEAYERAQKAAADKKHAELEAKRMALAEKLMVHGALAQRTCMAANFAFWAFSEVLLPHTRLRFGVHLCCGRATQDAQGDPPTAHQRQQRLFTFLQTPS